MPDPLTVILLYLDSGDESKIHQPVGHDSSTVSTWSSHEVRFDTSLRGHGKPSAKVRFGKDVRKDLKFPLVLPER